MEIEFDPAKDKANIAKQRVSLALASGFDFDAALIQTDDSEHYGEGPLHRPWPDRRADVRIRLDGAW